MIAIDFTTREHVHDIYSLQLSEEEKTKLLHQYHEGLDVLKMKEQEFYEASKFMERFYEEWEQKLEKAAQDAQLADHPT